MPNTCPLCDKLLHRFDSPSPEVGTLKELAKHLWGFHSVDFCPCLEKTRTWNVSREFLEFLLIEHFRKLEDDVGDHLRYHVLAIAMRPEQGE